MALSRGLSGSFVDGQAVTLGVAFPASDGVWVQTGEAAITLTFKSGRTVTMTTVSNTLLPFSLTQISGATGVYVALYK